MNESASELSSRIDDVIIDILAQAKLLGHAVDGDCLIEAEIEKKMTNGEVIDYKKYFSLMRDVGRLQGRVDVADLMFKILHEGPNNQ